MPDKETPEIYVLKFNLNIFDPKVRPMIRRYLDGELPAEDAAAKLGQTRISWERHMSGLFGVATNPNPDYTGPFLASITKEEV